MDEMNQLKSFVKAVKSQDYVNEDAQEVISAATDRYYGLKDTLKSISSAKGYADYFENWAPGQVEVEEDDIEDLKTKLTRQVFDDRITDTLPSVGRALRHKQEQAKMEDDDKIKDYFDTSVDPQEPADMAKADANTASSEQALADLASNDENIVVYDNPSKDEIKSYLAMMKQSDMPTDKKNQNMIVNIIEYLANNMVDDNAARALSNLDLGSPEGRKTGMQVAVKYLKGKVELQAPKAKKDKFGKTKEDTTFEAYAERMDLVSEGTWSLPENEDEAMKIAAMMDQPIALGDGGDDAINALGGLIGDDELFDDLGDAGDKDPAGDARPIIINWLESHVSDYNTKYEKHMQLALDNIKSAGNETNEEVELDEGMCSLKCKHCGDMLGQPTTDCEYNSQDPKGDNWVMVDIDGDGDNDIAVKNEDEIEEGRMSDLAQEIDEVAAEMEQNDMLAPFVDDFITMAQKTYDIKAALEAVLPDYVPGNMIKDLVGEAVEEVEEVDEAADMIAKMKSMAGVGSGARSNHGIHEGEEGYRLTPRSLVAREMRKLQDLEK